MHCVRHNSERNDMIEEKRSKVLQAIALMIRNAADDEAVKELKVVQNYCGSLIKELDKGEQQWG